MNVFTGYLVSAILAMTLAITIVLFLRKALYQLLVELCGNGARAQYWSIFSGLFLVLCTLYGVLVSLPDVDSKIGSQFPGIAAGLASFRAGVLGLLLAFSGVAIVLVLGIHRHENQLAQKPSSELH